jgi:hypothetical protein
MLALYATILLTRAVIVTQQPEVSAAATVLAEEIEKRTGIRLPVAPTPPTDRPAIVVTTQQTPHRAPSKPEGYRIVVDSSVWVAGTDGRGALFGAGALLRRLDLAKSRIAIEAPLDISSAPAYPIRGHQLGYRSTANSWDAWTAEQFDQYIRELAIFGVNSIENIPFQDPRGNPLMKAERREMNRAISAICKRYGLDYWVWTPADFDLNDAKRRADLLARFDELFTDSVELTGVFVPGGDPGHNPPELLWPFLEEVAKRMKPRHPKAGVWLSLQGFDAQKEEAVYKYLESTQPAWLTGLVHGPSSPSLARTRQRLPAKYKIRLYPDITHNKICQYQVPEWDQSYALTLGREAINPRPAEYAQIHNRWAALSDGFISYSDGVHDDVNKVVWSALAWDPSLEVRRILIDYARLHFAPGIAEEAADGILALERNWRGPLRDNGAVEATLLAWQRLESKAPELAGNWRWQMCLLRAVYDAYVRRKLLYETGLEEEANRILLSRSETPDRAMDEAMAVLNRAVGRPAAPDLRSRIIELCEKLFQSIGLQTSVEKYHASGAERGAVLDFIDNPLNNRWWLEDEFKAIRALPADAAKRQRLVEIATWANPGEGSFYDDIGNQADSPHVDGDAEQDPDSFRGPEPLFWWWDNGKSRARLSWQTTMWPRRMVYEGLDPQGAYVVRTSGYGQSLLKIDGMRASATADGKRMGEFKEFPVPKEQLADRRLILTWDIPADEDHLNWRQRSRLAEVWLLKRQ